LRCAKAVPERAIAPTAMDESKKLLICSSHYRFMEPSFPPPPKR
jgi:hypothetical protein